MATPHFSDRELAAASSRAPSESELLLWAEQVGWPVLEPMRMRWGPIAVTSWIRHRDPGAHEAGGAIDVQPLEASAWHLFAWAARHLRPAIGKMIYEPPAIGQNAPHLHIVRPGPEVWAGFGEFWIETRDGGRARYVPATDGDIPGMAPAPAGAVSSAVAVLTAALLVQGLAGRA